MGNVTESTTVNVPAADAFAQWSRFEELPRFMDGVRNVDMIGDGMTHWTIDIGGVTRDFDARVLSVELDRRVAWASVDGPRHAGSVEFKPLGDHATQITAEVDIDPEGFVENAADKLGVINLRLKRDLEQFKILMENPMKPRDGLA
ncbi:MAG TPA: SRPBCC family protein [Stackebrandtia sp.]|uniref:SRPBCC family protein n=1 Tax=Stackebrandtia sp. TaxID=2023065 RepID=UPI002D2F033A|nr:SRPBCC family protein [Stackebrandtia sp.]HZE41509.1 SRPBCC family protein [Stackebrandtia sp.]